MGIQFDTATSVFSLETARTSYRMRVDERGHLLHLYYGRSIGQGDLSALFPPADHGFSPDYYPCRLRRGVSPDVLPQEYTGCNGGDFRLSCLVVRDPDGAAGADFLYESHEITPGKYTLDGLPCAHDEGDEAETLCIRMKDPVTGLCLELLYGVFAEQDVITRAVRLKNAGTAPLRLEKAASACLDLPFGQWDLIHFHGRHAMERQVQRVHLADAIQTVSSTRGASSHHHNPFVILCDRQATEEAGACCGVMPVYSGSFRTDVELTQNGLVRLVTGIHDDGFCWLLQPGEQFAAPEVIFAYSDQGLGRLSQIYHRFLRHNICRGPWRFARRPVLINNWEATYFDFDTEKIVRIAEKAAGLGVELMVLDDGWFGKRNDDNSGLGDWQVNTRKLPGGLDPLIRRIHALGMKFGIWVEPEMVSVDSDLYRAHPDWAFAVPGRRPLEIRQQYTLDFSRPEVVDAVWQQLEQVLRSCPIKYLKWDMNRSLADVYSAALPAARQGEVYHRYVLGVYELQRRVTETFPDLLLENCAGGGARFDCGMLYYSPQIWCSDNTDARARLLIQYGTSLIYPGCVMGAHYSAVPNHCTGHLSTMEARMAAALFGTFGFELDLTGYSEEELAALRPYVAWYKAHGGLVRGGELYRLANPDVSALGAAWMVAAPDGSEAAVFAVGDALGGAHGPASLNSLPRLPLRGLDAAALYADETGERYTGAQLMAAGLPLPGPRGQTPACIWYLRRVDAHMDE